MMPDIGSKVTHTFHISNDGPWHVGDDNVNLIIDWPFQLSPPEIDGGDGGEGEREGEEEGVEDVGVARPGKWLLYLASEAEVTPPDAATCYLNPRMINHLGLRDRTTQEKVEEEEEEEVMGQVASLPKRRRREAVQDGGDKESPSLLSDADAVTINCVNGRARCMVLNCRIWHLRARENVVIR